MFFPEVNEIVTKPESGLGTDFKFKDGQHVLTGGGNLVKCSDRENLENWIRKVVETQAGIYEVYVRDEKESFGVSIYERIGTKERGYWLSELKREIITQLTASEYIDEVRDFKAEINKRKLEIDFTVICSDGVNINYSDILSESYTYTPPEPAGKRFTYISRIDGRERGIVINDNGIYQLTGDVLTVMYPIAVVKDISEAEALPEGTIVFAENTGGN